MDTLVDAGRAGQRDPQLSFGPGDLVAKRYRITRNIGIGGTGEVYEATDTSLGAQVALKTLNRTEAQFAESLERFRREMVLSRRVTHPNVVRNFDLGEHEDAKGKRILFLTMELLGGENLERRLKARGPLSPGAALEVARQIADGLDAAHDAGVIHRDVKPSNVMLLPAEEGHPERVVLTDFGLARSEQMDMVDLTASGDVIGTPLYMSPEQVKAGPATAASDIYSFGIVFYEMLSGKLPFHGTTPMAIALKRLKVPPAPIRQHVPDLDPTWEAAIGRCLELDPGKRFERAGYFVAALEGGAPQPSERRPLSRFLRRRR